MALKTIKVKKGIVEYISAMGMKVVFKSDIRFDRNGLHHTGWDVKTDNGVWGVYEGGELLN